MSELRHLHIDRYIRRYGIRSFVETGTNNGQGLEYALTLDPPLKRFDTCDLLPQFAGPASERWKDDKRVHIVCADSLTFLRQLPLWIGPSLYWLDAHQPWCYDQSIVETDETKFPVMREIAIIKERPCYEQDVIILDDLIALRESPRWHAGEIAEYFQIQSFTFRDLLWSLNDTHTAEIDLQQEGTVRFLPRRPKQDAV